MNVPYGYPFEQYKWKVSHRVADDETPEAKAEEWLESNVRYHVSRMAAELQFPPRFVGEAQWVKVTEMLSRLMVLAETEARQARHLADRLTSR